MVRARPAGLVGDPKLVLVLKKEAIRRRSVHAATARSLCSAVYFGVCLWVAGLPFQPEAGRGIAQVHRFSLRSNVK